MSCVSEVVCVSVWFCEAYCCTCITYYLQEEKIMYICGVHVTHMHCKIDTKLTSSEHLKHKVNTINKYDVVVHVKRMYAT